VGGHAVADPHADLCRPTVVGVVVGTDVDWDEVAELVTESYCIHAPKKLVALVDRPTD